MYADDYGRFNADPQIMLARLYPRELSDVTENDLICALIELDGVGKIGFYTRGMNEMAGKNNYPFKTRVMLNFDLMRKLIKLTKIFYRS